jgi:hypothetical protein
MIESITPSTHGRLGMSPSHDDLHRITVLAAARGLAEEARRERAALPASSPERQFYLGIEAAAEEVVYPELGESRSERWLELQAPTFRDGYLRTSDLVATAKTLSEPPLRLVLPEPMVAG